MLIDVLHVPNLGRNLLSCYRTTQKNNFTLHMKDGSQLIQKGNVVMTKVTGNKMYQLEIEVLTKDDLEVMHANVAKLFGVETNKESMQTLFMWHKQLAHLNHTMIKKMATVKMVDGLILEGKEFFFVWIMHMGRIIGSNFHGMNLEKDHNYLGTFCTLIRVIQCNKPMKGSSLFCLVQG